MNILNKEILGSHPHFLVFIHVYIIIDLICHSLRIMCICNETPHKKTNQYCYTDI